MSQRSAWFWQSVARLSIAAIASSLLVACIKLPPIPLPIPTTSPIDDTLNATPARQAPVAKMPDRQTRTFAMAERQAQTAVNSFIRAQSAYFLEKGEFAEDLSDLGVGIALEPGPYRYQVDYIDRDESHVVAIAQQPDLRSYLASVFVLEEGDALNFAMLTCATNEPSRDLPELPPIPKERKDLRCGSGSVRVN